MFVQELSAAFNSHGFLLTAAAAGGYPVDISYNSTALASFINWLNRGDVHVAPYDEAINYVNYCEQPATSYKIQHPYNMVRGAASHNYNEE